jgi:hypothetical protein
MHGVHVTRVQLPALRPIQTFSARRLVSIIDTGMKKITTEINYLSRYFLSACHFIQYLCSHKR